MVLSGGRAKHGAVCGGLDPVLLVPFNMWLNAMRVSGGITGWFPLP